MSWRLAPELEDETSPHFIPVVSAPADHHAYRLDLVAYGMGRTVSEAKGHAHLITAVPDLIRVARDVCSLKSEDGGRAFPDEALIVRAQEALAKAGALAASLTT